MADTVALTLIRHGATINNEKGVYQGWLDPPLLRSERERLARIKHHYPQPDRLLSSDLTRCLETAHVLYPNCELEISANFRELHFGDFEGKHYEQLKDDLAYQNWLEDPCLNPPPNGESFQTFTNRLQQGWDSLLSIFIDEVREIMIVTHGGVIRHYLEKYAPAEKAFWEWNVPLAGGYRLITTKEKLRRDERCISLSEVLLTAKPNG